MPAAKAADPTADEKLQYMLEHPEHFSQKALGSHPWSQQIEIMRSVFANRETYVAACHGIGKTRTSAELATAWLHTFSEAKVITLAPTERQVKALLWSEIRKVYAEAPYQLLGEPSQTEWHIGPDRFALGMSPGVEVSPEDMGVRLQGFHSPNLLLIFDEAPGIHEALWDAKDGLLTSKNAHFLAIGNPVAASGRFYQAWSKRKGNRVIMSLFASPNFVAAKCHGLDDLKRMAKWPEEKLKALPTPYPALSTVIWAVAMLNKWGEDSPLFISRVMSQFPAQGSDALIALAWLEACERSEPEVPRPNHPVKALGVDVARFGSNNTAMVGFLDRRQCFFEVQGGMDTARTANRVIQLIRDEEYGAVAIDVVGIGAGVYDRVAEWRSHSGAECVIIPFGAGEASTEPARFVNLRAEAYWRVREAVQARSIRVEEKGDLFHQLTSIKYKFTTSGGPAQGGQIALETKEQMSRRGLPSPDEADALVMALWASDQIDERSGSGSGTGWLDNTLADTGAERVSARPPWQGL